MNEQPTPDVSEEPKRSRLLERIAPRSIGWRTAVVVPLLAVLSALIVGSVLIVITEGAGAVLPAYRALFSGAFVGWNSISETLLLTTPLILAGLSVALGFRAGLFNIGVEGQMTIGGLTAVMVGISFSGLPAIVHLPLAIVAGFLGGALWGFIPGVLRARTGAHEVITTIMLNYVAFNLMLYILKIGYFQAEGRKDPISKVIFDSARLPKALSWLPFEGADGLRLNIGILIALAMAFIVYWLLFRATTGFEFRAVGANPDAAKYGGIRVTTAIVLVMAIAGGLGGMAGANQTLGVYGYAFGGFTGGIGFDAIALALLGRSHPAGVVLASILFGALRVGSRTMQTQTDVGVDLIFILQALIVVFIAAPELVRAIYRVKTGEEAQQLTRGWST